MGEIVFSGWILDAAPTISGLRLTISNGADRVNISLKTDFELFLKPRVSGLVEQLVEHPSVLGVSVEEWFAPPWYNYKTMVHRLSFSNLCGLAEVKELIGGQRLGELYNCFPDPVTQVFMRKGYPATVKVQLNGSNLVPVEDPLRVGYETPNYSWAEFKFFDWFGETTFTRLKKRPERFELRLHRETSSVRVAGRLEELGCYLSDASRLDIVSYPKSFEWVLVEEGFDPKSVPLITHGSGFGASSLREELVRLVEWSRISFMPLRELFGASIGKPLTANEARLAFQRRYLVAEHASRIEKWKTLKQLVQHDRGGTVLRPYPGVYFNVAQLDFSSMYPSIISKWNISPETVNDSLAESMEIPGSAHRVELGRQGLVAEAMAQVISRREETRRLVQLGDPVQELRQTAIKWLLVASFGYLGYRNSKFGKIEAYECVTALSRHCMDKAIRLAIKLGFKVHHVIVDSLFVSKENCTQKKYEELVRAIRDETGLNIKLEALYDWVVFVNNKGSPLGSTTRYFGRLNTGRLKTKGVDSVRSDSPPLVRNTQKEAIRVLRQAKTKQEFIAKLRVALGLFDACIGRIRRGEIEPKDYVFNISGGRRLKVDKQDASIFRHSPWTMQVIQGSGLYPAELGFNGVNTDHYVKLVRRAQEQISPRNVVFAEASSKYEFLEAV
jgi:hypothetical protein